MFLYALRPFLKTEVEYLSVRTGEISKFYSFWAIALQIYTHITNSKVATWIKFH